ncbi:ABC transporter ATP-binding protein [Virgibacillus sp. W0430]|uniref:ABC transporter ATP-binding protein n=1 Tax=Virgibacillus sp. W0430 TaxID=3391580 RepID=UPI003F447DF6
MMQICNVTKVYNKKNVLNNVSLTIPVGSCYGLAGPNGAGKSTLIKIIASIIKQDKGTVTINEQKPQRMKQNIGYVPQEVCLEQHVTTFQNLCFFGRLYGLKGKRLIQRANTILTYIGLNERKNDKVSTFSGGMKRRLNIGCALMNEPTLIIMDEPTVGIDPQSRLYIFDMIARLKQTGVTIIYATHYMEEIERVCDEVAFIDQGEVVENGSVNELIQKYATPSVFVQGPEINEMTFEYLGDFQRKQNGYLIMTRNPMQTMEKLLGECRKKALPLDRIELVQPRIEDVFFKLTGNSLRT